MRSKTFTQARSCLRPGSYLGNIVALAGSTILSQGLFVIASPLITRLYSPSDLGAFGLVTAYVNFVTVGVSLRYETAIVAARDDKEAAHLTAASLVLALMLSLTSAAGLLVLIHNDALGYGAVPLWMAAVAFPACLLTGAFLAVRYWLIRMNSFDRVSRTVVMQSIARTGGQIALGVLGWGASGLLVADVLGRSTGAAGMLREAWPKLRASLVPYLRADTFDALRRNKRFPLLALPSSLLDSLGQMLVLPLTAALFGTAAAGQLALVQRVIAVPLMLVGATVADAFHNQLATHVNQATGRAKALFLKTGLALFGISLIVIAPLVLAGPALFRIFFGPDWEIAGLLAACMAPWIVGQLAIAPLSRAAFVVGGQGPKLIYDVLATVSTMGSMYLARALNFTLPQAILLLSLLHAAAYAVYFLVLYRSVRSH